MMKDREKVLTINNCRQKMLGIVYNAKHKKSDKLIIFCNPFAEEEKELHLHLSNFARLLSNNGINVIRFHYRGTGDSFGKFEDYTLNTRVSDIEKVIDYARACFPRAKIGLFGVRLGASLASLTAEKNNIIEYLLLWEPIVNGKNVLNELYRFRYKEENCSPCKILEKTKNDFLDLKKTGYMDLYGYKISRELVKDIEALDLINSNKKYKNNLLIIQNSGRGLNRFKEKYKNTSKNLKFIELKTESYWMHFRYKLPLKLFQITLDWILEN